MATDDLLLSYLLSSVEKAATLLYCPQLPEAGHADGENFEETIEVLKDALRIVFKEMVEAGEEIHQSKAIFLTTVEVDL